MAFDAASATLMDDAAPAAATAPAAAAKPAFDPSSAVPIDAKTPAIPTMRITPQPRESNVIPQGGDVPSQQPQQDAGNFFATAHGPPPAMAPIVQRAAAKYGVPIWVANWVGAHESNWNTAAIGPETSHGRAKGVWQFMDPTAKEMGLADPHDFPTATDAAMRYLRQLADRNGGDWTKAVEAYGTFSTGRPHQDARAKEGFQAFMKNTGTNLTPAQQDAKFAGYDTADTTPEDDPEYVPFRDPPGTQRGTILPIMRDPQGNYSLAVPDIFRAPIRGAIEGGQEARGVRPVDDPRARGDIFAAAGAAGTPAAKMFANGAQRAAATLGDASAGMVADDTPPMPFGKTPQGKAEAIIARRMNQDVQGGGAMVRPPVQHGPPEPPPLPGEMPPLALTPGPADNVVANLDRMGEAGKPGTLIDVGGPNVRALAGSVARKPGPAQAVIRGTMEERDAQAGARAQADVRRYLTAGPSAYRTARDLIAKRSEEAEPLYRKAFEGGSMAPLKDQFETAWNEASKAEKQAAGEVDVANSQLTAALAKQPVTGGNVYSESAAGDGVRAARRNLAAAQQRQAEAAQLKQQVLDHLRVAQHDIENDTPGAVWNPRIQQFLDLPDVRKGLARGFQIQRNDAVADGVPFNPMEYALTPDGEVIRVPNMRTLNVAKKGLDAIIADNRDEFGRLTEYGVSVDKVRRAFLSEIDKINPDYAKARASWAGHSASLDALKWGRNIGRLPPEQVAEEFAHMSGGEKEFARLGLADTLLERIGKTSFGGDEAKNLIKNTWTQEQLQPLFRSQADFTRYVESVAHERRMYDTQTDVLKGSQTAARREEDNSNDLSAAGHALHGAANLVHGNWLRAMSSAARAVRDLGLRPNPELNEAIARSLVDPTRRPTIVNGQFTFQPPP
jgi:hypothetical protein